MKSKIIYIVALFMLSLVFVGCASKSCGELALSEKLKDSTWEAIYLANQGNAKQPKGSDEIVFVHFAEDLKINGMSGDNLFGGEVKLSEDGAFSADKMYSTKRMGPYGEYEMKFLKAFSQTNMVKVLEDKLYFYDTDKLMIEFKRIKNRTKDGK